MKRIKQGIGCLAIGIVVFGIADAGLWLSGHMELAISAIAFVFALGIFAAGNVWGAMLMKGGADLTIRSQESDDKRDIAQIKAATDLVRVLVRQEDKETERERREQEQQTKLPIPQNFLPQLTEFSEGEFEEVN